jgi:hypothetical protein
MATTVDERTQSQRRLQKSSSSTRDLLLALPFLVLLYVQLGHHVLWRDELNALAIAWASPTIPSLFWHIHHEGHPWLWYMILWIPSRFTHSLLVLKVVQGIVSTAIVLFVALRSPFRRWEKALILAGYFLVFEYTVLSRMYGVVLLILVLYLWRRTEHPESPIGSAVLLGIMASSDTIAIILSVALILEYAYFAYWKRRTAPLFARLTALKAIGVYAIITAFAVWSGKPASDISWRTTGRPFADAKSISHLYDVFLRYTVFPFIPVKSPRSHFFWNPTFHLGNAIDTLPMIPIVVLLYFIFRRHGNLMLLVGSMILGGTAFGHLIYLGSVRHYGFVFLVFLSGLWILRAACPSALLPLAAYILLAVSVLSGVWAVIASWHHPFSYGRAAAEWIVSAHLDQMPLVADDDTSAVSVTETLHRPAYFIECSCVDTYVLYSSRRDNFTKAEAPERILQASHFYHDAPLLFLSVFPMKPDEKEGLEKEGFRIEPLASFSEAEDSLENFYFYRLTLTNQPGSMATLPR